MIHVILLGCDNKWSPTAFETSNRQDLLHRAVGGSAVSYLLTPKAALWVGGDALQQRRPSNPLASALLTFLQLPITQLFGPAYITGQRGQAIVGLTDVQLRGFTQILQMLCRTPEYLTLHAQACRIASAWHAGATGVSR